MGRVRDVQLFTLFRNFLTIYLPVQRKVSENTVVDYRISLNQLIEYISKKQQVPYMSVTFEMITKDNVNSFWTISQRKRSSRLQPETIALQLLSPFFHMPPAFTLNIYH